MKDDDVEGDSGVSNGLPVNLADNFDRNRVIGPPFLASACKTSEAG